MNIEAIKTQAGYCDPEYDVCCEKCDYCVQLKRNYKCIRYGFIVSKAAVCRAGFTPRPADSMMQQLYKRGPEYNQDPRETKDEKGGEGNGEVR